MGLSFVGPLYRSGVDFELLPLPLSACLQRLLTASSDGEQRQRVGWRWAVAPPSPHRPPQFPSFSSSCCPVPAPFPVDLCCPTIPFVPVLLRWRDFCARLIWSFFVKLSVQGLLLGAEAADFCGHFWRVWAVRLFFLHLLCLGKANRVRSREESARPTPYVFVAVWVREALVCVEVEELGSSMLKLPFRGGGRRLRRRQDGYVCSSVLTFLLILDSPFYLCFSCSIIAHGLGVFCCS
jgi:hypothetical protein